MEEDRRKLSPLVFASPSSVSSALVVPSTISGVLYIYTSCVVQAESRKEGGEKKSESLGKNLARSTSASSTSIIQSHNLSPQPLFKRDRQLHSTLPTACRPP